MGTDPKGYANPGLLIAPDDLADLLARAPDAAAGPRAKDAGPPVVIDLRPAEAFAAGHVPGAVHLDLFGLSLIDTSPAPLEAFLWMIAHLLAARGASADRTVVVYDERSGIRAARAFWFLELFGHPDARLLDGGFGGWSAAGHPVTTRAAPPAPADWAVGRVAARLATWRDARARGRCAGRRARRHAQRRRAPGHRPPRPSRRRDSRRGPRRVDPQPRPLRGLLPSPPRPSGRCTRGPASPPTAR